MIEMSPEYWSCPACGNGEAWLLCDGRIMCADWPDCGAVFAGVDEWRAGREPDAEATP